MYTWIHLCRPACVCARVFVGGWVGGWVGACVLGDKFVCVCVGMRVVFTPYMCFFHHMFMCVCVDTCVCVCVCARARVWVCLFHTSASSHVYT